MIPLWLLKECAVHGVKALTQHLQGSVCQAFHNEKVFWYQLGLLAGLCSFTNLRHSEDMLNVPLLKNRKLHLEEIAS
jgi:hypothetical protein